MKGTAHNPLDRQAERPAKSAKTPKKRGFRRIVAAVVLLVAAGTLWSALRPPFEPPPTPAQKGPEQPAPSQPPAPPPPKPPEEWDETWQQKSNRLGWAIARGQSEAAWFTIEELNQMIADAQARGEFEGTARLDSRGAYLVADIAMAIPGVPALEGAPLKAEVTLDCGLDEDSSRLIVRDIAKKAGNWHSNLVLAGLKNRNLAQMFRDTDLFREIRRCFSRIQIRDGRMLVVTRAHPDRHATSEH